MTEEIPGNGEIQSSSQAFPTEICEKIIDMLYSYHIEHAHRDMITLHSCSLVCRAWRVRSQKMLFYRVQLSDNAALHRFSAVLDFAQRLRGYVHEVFLTGYYLHTTTSILTLFPTVFVGRLPNLSLIVVAHLPETMAWFPRPPDPPPDPGPKEKLLPYIPLHPRFPTFLSSFKTVTTLDLRYTTFSSFSEFARMLRALPNLESLVCASVRWISPGADFTAMQPGWMTGNLNVTLPPFAWKLQKLAMGDISAYGAKRLISTQGPSLTRLRVTIPLSCSSSSEEPPQEQGFDLSACSELRELFFYFQSGFPEKTYHMVVKRILKSWKPKSPACLTVDTEDSEEFTGQDFADIIRTISLFIDTWIEEGLIPAGHSERNPPFDCDLVVRLKALEADRQWWRDWVERCFPTWARLKRLDLQLNVP